MPGLTSSSDRWGMVTVTLSRQRRGRSSGSEKRGEADDLQILLRIAREHFAGDRSKIGGKRLFLLLDYDGTLVPIRRAPRLALPSRRLLRILRSLSTDHRIGLWLISGRNLDSLRGLLQGLGDSVLKRIVMVGTHGGEVSINGKAQVNRIYSKERLRELQRIRKDLEKRFDQIPDCLFEDKKFSIAVHYRRVDPSIVESVIEGIRRCIKEPQYRGGYEIIFGKKVADIRLVGVDKGRFLVSMRSQFKDGLAFCFGDDQTDEDGFRAINDWAVTCKVGRIAGSSAVYRLRNTGRMLKFLEELEIALGCDG